MSSRNKDLRDCLTAYDCSDRLPGLRDWLSDDQLKQVTIWRGARFRAGESYFDLDNPRRGPFVAAGDEGPITDHTYVARGEVTEGVWARLITWGQPVSETQGRAIDQLARDFGAAGAQSAAGEARPVPRAKQT